MGVVGVSLYDLLRHGVLPALLPGPPMMAMLYAIRWAFEPSALFPVSCAAFVGLTTYSIVYVGLCAGDAESKLLEDLRARTAVKKRFIIHDLQGVAR